MSSVRQQTTPNAGRGLFSSEPIAAGHEILRIDRPLVAALDSSHLKDACANCFLWTPNDGRPSGDELVKLHDNQTELQSIDLKNCLGCKVVSYCSKKCQSTDWKHGHKHECPIYRSLHPQVLPNTVRLLLRLLLRNHHSTLPPSTWNSFLSLQPHTPSFKSNPTKNADNLTTWETLALMSRSILQYTPISSPLETIQSLLARVMINTHTLTTGTLDPLGLCLEPRTALLNHSCSPNSYLVFSGPVLSLRSLHPISEGEELTIAYIDTTNPAPIRRGELGDRYFFTCACPACSKGLTNGASDPPDTLATRTLWADVTTLQSEAARLPPDEAKGKLKTAIDRLEKEGWAPSRQPYAALLHSCFLNAVAGGEWVRALKVAVKAGREVEPTQYPVPWHPVRVVRKWVLLKLVVQIGGMVMEGEASVRELVGKGVDLRVVALRLWKEVMGLVGKSHGEGSRFAVEVKGFGEETGMAAQGQAFDEGAYRSEWETLGKVLGDMKW